MKILITREQKKVIVRIHTRGSTRGDLFHIIYPGRTWQGWSYQELWDMGAGNHELEVPRQKEEEEA